MQREVALVVLVTVLVRGLIRHYNLTKKPISRAIDVFVSTTKYNIQGIQYWDGSRWWLWYWIFRMARKFVDSAA